jgi:hypothetical protein
MFVTSTRKHKWKKKTISSSSSRTFIYSPSLGLGLSIVPCAWTILNDLLLLLPPPPPYTSSTCRYAFIHQLVPPRQQSPLASPRAFKNPNQIPPPPRCHLMTRSWDGILWESTCGRRKGHEHQPADSSAGTFTRKAETRAAATAAAGGESARAHEIKRDMGGGGLQHQGAAGVV